jgi:hypothetical protein
MQHGKWLKRFFRMNIDFSGNPLMKAVSSFIIDGGKLGGGMP